MLLREGLPSKKINKYYLTKSLEVITQYDVISSFSFFNFFSLILFVKSSFLKLKIGYART